MHDDDHDHDHDHDGGLAADLPRWCAFQGRRRLLRWGALGTAAAAAPLATVGTVTRAAAACVRTPAETPGPFPGNGTNRNADGPADVLAMAGIVRTDLRRSLGGARGVAAGVPMRLNLTLLDAAQGCKPLAGAAVYLWHCDREGRYSMYSPGVENENYLRGVQPSNAAGELSFTTIVPGCYPGRTPHLHFEVYRTVPGAADRTRPLLTSQLALPGDACATVYQQAAGYGQSGAWLRRTPLERDGVVADGAAQQLARMTGSPQEGYTATLSISVSVSVSV